MVEPLNALVRRLAEAMSALEPGQARLAALLMMPALAIADFATGWAVHFNMFYVLPVWLIAWRIGAGEGWIVALACASISTSTQMLEDSPLNTPSLLLWNTFSRFVILAFVASLLDAQRQALQQSETLARTDPLTGALNRRAFMEAATSVLARDRRAGFQTGLLYIDLDDFKNLNDRHGHAAGDRLLMLVVEVAQANCRAGDVVARLGGDEFAIIIAGGASGGIEPAARRLCTILRRQMIAFSSDAGFSAGLCLVQPGDTEIDSVDVLKEADRLLYRAKGRSDNEHLVIGEMLEEQQPTAA